MLSNQELLLVAVMEECSEVAKRASKALRFGLYEQKEGRDKNNLQLFAEEITDLLFVINAINDTTNGDLEKELEKLEDSGAFERKAEKFAKYKAYSQEKGCVEPDVVL